MLLEANHNHENSPCVKISGFFLFSAKQHNSGYDKNEKKLAKPAVELGARLRGATQKHAFPDKKDIASPKNDKA